MSGRAEPSHPRLSYVLSESQLVEWGERIASQARLPLVLALRGDLGAGKSTLARAVARGMGVKGPIPSPTFNLMYRYPTERGATVVHLDLYRLETEDEVWELGWADLPGPDEMVLIEWPQRAERLLPSPRWEVHLRDRDDGSLREVGMHPVGDPPDLPLPPVLG